MPPLVLAIGLPFKSVNSTLNVLVVFTKPGFFNFDM